jgi:hypothetical protein
LEAWLNGDDRRFDRVRAALGSEPELRALAALCAGGPEHREELGPSALRQLALQLDSATRDRLAREHPQRLLASDLSAASRTVLASWMVRPTVVRELPIGELEALANLLTERVDSGDPEAGPTLGRLLIYWSARPTGSEISPLAREVWREGGSGLMSLCVRLLGDSQAGERALFLMLLDRADPPLGALALAQADVLGIDLLSGIGAVDLDTWGARGALVLTRRLLGLCRVGVELTDPLDGDLAARFFTLRRVTARRFGDEVRHGWLPWVSSRSERASPRQAVLRRIRRLCENPTSHRPDLELTRLFSALLALREGDRNWQAMIEAARSALCDAWQPSAETRRRLGQLLRSVRPDQTYRDWAEQAATLCQQTVENAAAPPHIRLETALLVLQAAQIDQEAVHDPIPSPAFDLSGKYSC